MTFSISPIVQHRGVSKTSFPALKFINATDRLGHWLSNVHNKGQNHTEDVYYHKKISKSRQRGEAALCLHTSISGGKRDQRMFSEPQPADLIIGCLPVCFPSLADTGQKRFQKEDIGMLKAVCHFSASPPSIRCPCLTGLF